MRNCKRIIGILTGVAIFIGITHILDSMYVTRNRWTRIVWHHFYEDVGKIDNLYLGSSHVFYSIDPQILDRLSGEYNFNLATPAQPLNGSYYLLREADKHNELSHVYLDMYYDCNTKEALTRYSYNWNNTDNMKMSFNRIAYMASIGGVDQYSDILLPFSRFRECLGDWDYIKERLDELKQKDYINYRYDVDRKDGNGHEVIERKGFFNSTKVFKDSNKCYKQEVVLDGYSMDERNEEYVGKIIEYCREKEIPITLFVVPMSDLELISTLNYDSYITEVRKLASKYGVPFYDFNLAKEEYLPLQDSSNFRDADHLNKFGADLFTPFLYQVLTGKEGDNEKYFYRSYKEKMENLTPTIYGIYYNYLEENGDPNAIRMMRIASNRDSGMEYKIILTPNEEESYIVQNFEENKQFQISSSEHGLCTIEVRMKEFPNETIQTMEIQY